MIGILAVTSVFKAPAVMACAVCFGEAEGAGLEGLWASASLLVGLVYGLLTTFGVVLWRARQRVRASLVRGEAGGENAP